VATTLVIGRDPGCDVVLDHKTVSTRHARLVQTRSGLVIEDLGSTNGTYLDDARIERVRVERGSHVRIGDVILPWSDPKIVAFTKQGATRGTLVMSAVANAVRGRPPANGAASETKSSSAFVVPGLVGASVLVALIGAAVYVLAGNGEGSVRRVVAPDGAVVEEPLDTSIAGTIRRQRTPGILAALDSTNPITRNTAVKIAAGDEGPFHVEQVARLWTHVRGRWRYVNDPQGGEYFAKASETITNEYAGDCDDFATVLVAMITSIGGEARVVVMDSDKGGHAYAEACVHMEAGQVATRLQRYYRRKWDPYLGRQRIERIHYRSTEACPLWLNLDWSAGVPGGPYSNEVWAVGVETNGTTEALVPARADAPAPAHTEPPKR